MVEIVSFHFERNGISENAIKLLCSAVEYARSKNKSQVHTISLEYLCKLSKITILSKSELLQFLRELSNAVINIEFVEANSNPKKNISFLSFPILNKIALHESNVSFEICEEMFNENIQKLFPYDFIKDITALNR